jgi:integrase
VVASWLLGWYNFVHRLEAEMLATLSKSVVDKIQPNSIVWDTKISGLGARRQRGHAVNYVLKHKGKWFTIGRHGSPWTVEMARAEALQLLGTIVSGQDPRPATSGKVGEVVTLYLARRKPVLKPKSFDQIERHLLAHAKPLHSSELHEVTRRTVAELLAKVEQGSGPVSRNRVRSSLSAFYAWCIREGLTETNPVAGTGKAEEGGARERVLTPKEIAKIWTTLVAGQHVHFIDIVRLLLLTGQRREEIAGLMWSEVDFERKLIVLPAARTKNNRVHIIPLSPPTLAILRTNFHENITLGKGNDGRVFRSFRWNEEKARFDAALNFTQHWTIHDIRRSVATHLADKLGVLPHVVEAVLNHVSGHKAGVAGTYNRAKYEAEMRDALTRWADWIEANAE